MQTHSPKRIALMFGLTLLFLCDLSLRAEPATSAFPEQNEQWDSHSEFRSFDACLKAAQKGNVKAQLELGDAYQNGIGTSVDYDKSIFWFKKTAQRGNPRGLLQMAFAFVSGKGVDINKSMVFLYTELAIKCGDEFVAKGLNSITFKEIIPQHVMSSRVFAATWKPGSSLPPDDYFPADQAAQVSARDTSQSPMNINPTPQFVLEYHISQNTSAESFGTGTFSNEGANGWDLIALIQQQPPPTMPGPSMPSMPVDAIFKRRRNINISNGYIRWEYKFISTFSFNTNDSMLGADSGWEIATVFRSTTGIPPLIVNQFVVALKRRLPN